MQSLKKFSVRRIKESLRIKKKKKKEKIIPYPWLQVALKTSLKHVQFTKLVMTLVKNTFNCQTVTDSH